MNTPPANTLYYGDNLFILRQHIADASIDLIYLNPPFGSGRTYNFLYTDASVQDYKSQTAAFRDTWIWDSVAAATYHHLITSTSPHISETVSALHTLLGNTSLMVHIVMITVRLIELRRVLKPDGSLFLHCDSTASHYLKIVLDAIFGGSNFRNEIIWQRQSAHSDAKTRFSDVSDTILFYAHSAATKFHPQYSAHDPEYVKKFYRFDDGDGRGPYRFGDMASPNPRPNLMYKWLGFPHPAKGWRYSQESMQKLHDEGRIYYPRLPDGAYDISKRPALKRYLNEQAGSIITNVWTDIAPVHSTDAHRMGYPNQKPLALLERIIQASSRPGDLCLDPFSGCGTLIEAAQALDRHWIGIDITHLGIAMIKARMEAMYPGIQINVVGEPKDVAAARQLAQDDPYQFRWWVLSLVAAHPIELQSRGRTEKRGSDRAIDGVIHFIDDNSGQPKSMLVRVKSGAVESGDVEDLRGTLERDKSALAVFITLEEPTQEIVTEAASAGYYHSPDSSQDYPRLQIVTITQLQRGAQIQMPRVHATFRQAKPVRAKATNEPLAFDAPDDLGAEPSADRAFLSTAEVAEKIDVPLGTVRNWVAQGKIPGAQRIGRDWQIPESALADFKRPVRGRPEKSKS